MEIVYLTVRCFLHPSCFSDSVEIVAPMPVPRVIADVITLEKTHKKMKIEVLVSPVEPPPAPKLRVSPGLSGADYHKNVAVINDKLKRTFKNFDGVKIVSAMIQKEITAQAAGDQEREWMKLCAGFKESARNSAATIAIGKQIIGDVFDVDNVDPEAFYVQVLHFRIQRLFDIHARVLDKLEMFKKYHPMVMYMVQKDFTQEHIIPSGVENYLSYDEAVRRGLLPCNIASYIPILETGDEKWTFCCVGLFHSFVHRVNFVSSYWKSNKGGWKSSLVNFDRHIKAGENQI
jgi:hypothetical protein